MGRTYLRQANTQDVSDVDESYANFASYTGINESKSFIDVDQNSFEEANNVYVNIDNELSTRPPVNSHSIDVIDSSYNLLDVFKVNGITFYKYIRPFKLSDVDYVGILSSDVQLSSNKTYSFTDTTYNFTWIDGLSVHSTGTVLVYFTSGDYEYYAIADYALNTEDADEFEVKTYNGNECTFYLYENVNEGVLATCSGLKVGDVINLANYEWDSGYSYLTYNVLDASGVQWLLTVYDSVRNLIYAYTGYIDGEYSYDSNTGYYTYSTLNFTITQIAEVNDGSYSGLYEISDSSYTITTTKVISYNDDNTQVCITWKYGNSTWNEDLCVSEFTNVYYVQDWYIFVDSVNNTIYGYKYNYDDSVWEKYELADLIHIPTVVSVEGTSRTEDEGAYNLFTTVYNEVYTISSTIVTNTDDLDGQIVTVQVGDETFTLVWDSNYTVRLSTAKGVISYDVDTIIASKPADNRPIFVAYCDHWLDVDGNPGFYYSIDCTLWAKVSMPSDLVAGSYTACLSDAGFNVWVANTPTQETTTIGDDEVHDDSVTIYYTSLPSTIYSENLDLSWSSVTLSGDDISSNTYSFSSDSDFSAYGSSYSNVYENMELNVSYNPISHCPEDGTYVAMYPVTSFRRQTLWNGSGYGNRLSSSGKTYNLLIIANSYSINAYITDTIYEGSTYTLANIYTYGRIRFSDSNDSYRVISLYKQYDRYTASAVNTDYICIYPIICDENYKPFFKLTDYWLDDVSRCVDESVFTFTYGSLQYMPLCMYTPQMLTFDSYELLQDGVMTYCLAYYQYSYYTSGSNFDSDVDPTSRSKGSYYTTISFNLTSTTDNTLFTGYTYHTAGDGEYSDVTYNVELMSQYSASYFKIYHSSTIKFCITDQFIYRYGNVYSYLERDDATTNYPIVIYDDSATIDSSVSIQYMLYWSPNNNTIYSTDYSAVTVTRTVTSRNDNTFTEDDVTVVDISFANELYTTTIATQNLLYQATAAPDGSGKLYFRTDSKVELPDTITGMIYFSQTVLAIFVPYTAFEYTASSSDDGIVYYYLYPTKLVLGNREGYDILQSYDGSTIYICTERGMAALTYETLVSSTEHIFSYLTDNILTSYKEFDDEPVLFCQYVRWIFMYRQDSNICYIYDMSGSSWWKWTLPYNITKMYADTDNDKLLLIMQYGLYYFNFDADDFYDIETIRIDWSFKSQKLHLSAPNNYKHLRWLSVVTTQDTDTMRYKLKFTNYRHWHHMQDSSVVEYEINQLGTMRKKINFVKCNAFQFEISNDKTWKQPEKFVISNIAIKYRITEGIR